MEWWLWLLLGMIVLSVPAQWGRSMWRKAWQEKREEDVFLCNRGILRCAALWCWFLFVLSFMFLSTQVACVLVGWLLQKLAWVIATIITLATLWVLIQASRTTKDGN